MAHTVAVTGGSGFIATELIKQLLEKGYHVRATVRSTKADEKFSHLIKLGEALPGRLELAEADLLKPGSFDGAFAGCRYVFHTASPFFIEAEDPQAQLVDVAVEGTRNVMLAAARAGSGLQRVVLTSSCAAVKGMNPPVPKSSTIYSEEDWNETSTVAGGEAYWVGKTQAERAAWELAKKHNIDLVTILPEFVMGPLLSSRGDGTSVGYMRAWVQGEAQKGAPVFADVRDVARAHVLAAETAAASGRYIVANASSTSPQQITAWLRERFPDSQFADPEEEGSKAVMDNSKGQRELGLAITPVCSTIIDMAVTMIQLGLAKLKSKS